MNRFAALIAMAVLIPGCICRRSGGTHAADRTWSVGRTTRRDVVEGWGNPDSMHGNVWTWRENRQLGGKVKASYYGVGITISNVNAATCEHRLEFDDQGILVAHDTEHSVPESASWSIIPW